MVLELLITDPILSLGKDNVGFHLVVVYIISDSSVETTRFHNPQASHAFSTSNIGVIPKPYGANGHGNYHYPRSSISGTSISFGIKKIEKKVFSLIEYMLYNLEIKNLLGKKCMGVKKIKEVD